ncbi:MAG: hypothetical protein WED34_08310 [Planctomycetales bacterium]
MTFRSAFFSLCGGMLLLLLGAASAWPQVGPGLEPFNWRTRGGYQYGFQPLFDVVVFNESGETLFFEVANYTTAVKQTARPGNAWEVESGEIGRPEILARRIDAGFRTENGRYLLVEPQHFRLGGRDIALYHVTAADLARVGHLRADEADRAEAFRKAMAANVSLAASRTAATLAESRPASSAPLPEIKQSAYRLKVEPRLSIDVRNWVWAREHAE